MNEAYTITIDGKLIHFHSQQAYEIALDRLFGSNNACNETTSIVGQREEPGLPSKSDSTDTNSSPGIESKPRKKRRTEKKTQAEIVYGLLSLHTYKSTRDVTNESGLPPATVRGILYSGRLSDYVEANRNRRPIGYKRKAGSPDKLPKRKKSTADKVVDYLRNFPGGLRPKDIAAALIEEIDTTVETDEQKIALISSALSELKSRKTVFHLPSKKLYTLWENKDHIDDKEED